MPSPAALKQLRVQHDSTFNTAFTAGNDASWDYNATIGSDANFIRCQTIDTSGLVFNNEPDGTIQTRMYGAPGPIPTLRQGELKFSTYLGGATATTAHNMAAFLCSRVMGGIQAPNQRTYTLTGTPTTTTLFATNIDNEAIGSAVLVTYAAAGVAPQVRVITDNTTGGQVTVAPALSNAPVATDTVTISTTSYLDESAAQQYMDFLYVAHDPNDQRNMIGCMGPFTMGGLNPGELPMLDFTMAVGDWREESNGTLDTLDTTNGPDGAEPPVNRGLGYFLLSDNGGALKQYKISDLSIDPGVQYEGIPDLNGVNGICGWQKIPGRPTASFSVVLDNDADELPGLHNDYVNGTTKTMIAQFGSVATRCVAVDMSTAYINASPGRTDIGALAGMNISLHGDENTGTTNLEQSSIRIHWF